MDSTPCFVVFLLCILFLTDHVYSQVGLQPGQFNLATGRKVMATATCGEGIGHPEMYCKLTGANLERGDQQQRVGHEKYFIVQGQICDYCDATSPDQSHPAENAIDGTERWWQSPPLSRGGQFMEVNLTIDFSQEFHVAYILVTMGNSPRPELWTLERSTDYGKTWTPWQHFADPPSDCETYFGVEPDQPLIADDQVICTSKFSRLVPLEGGEIVVSLVNDRPGRDNFLSNMVLQNWTKATNVRFNFQRMKTLMGHSTGVARQDQTVTRRYYYSVRDISIGGLCVCNGHASSCGVQNPNEPYRQTCKCEHNTCGPYCDRCCPGFVQKKWKPAMVNSSNACEACNCHGHSGECDYDPDVDAKHLSLDTHGNYEGGGVCRNCYDNTEGINCDKCRAGYYRPYGKSKSDRDACQICRCDGRFSTGNCAEGTGICECKPNFTGTNCDRCNNGYFDYPRCTPCECNYNGTINQICNAGVGNCPCKANYAGLKCDQCAENFYDFPNCTACDCETRGTVAGTSCERSTGQCVCNNNFGGRRCDQCGDGYFNHPVCSPCDCDPAGTEKEICNKASGTCLCKPGHTGPRCDRSAPGFYNYPQVLKCECHPAGSLNDVCDSSTGRCPCKNNFSGRACDMCAAGYYKFPECLACNCDTYGTIGTTCDHHGQCQCKKNFVGKACNQCGEGFYNYPLCEGCNCNPAGLIASFGGCGKVEGELCQCKERVTGRICDQCKTGFWGLDRYNPAGCDECQCHTPGTVSALSVCEGRTGSCPCKTNVETRQCLRCKDGFFKLEDNNLHGCGSCGCDVGGAVSPVCEKNTGQCSCRPRINGKNCSQVLKLHYFPTLHHLKFEAEDGRAKENGPVQYEFKEEDFPNYSWRGYAVMSPRQQEIQIPIHIRKPSLYRMLVRYVNLANTTSRADILVSPESKGEADQKAHVDFVPSRDGKYVSVGEGTNANTFVLHPGQWQVTVKSPKPVLIDYIVLLPQAYYEATLLQQSVQQPCLHGQSQTCRNFTYPDLEKFININPTNVQTFYLKNGDRLTPQIDDSTRRGVKGVLIDQSKPELTLIAEIFPTEPHHLIFSYFTRDGNGIKNLKVSVSNRSNEATPTEYQAALYSCPYEHLCRSAILDKEGKLAVFSPTDRFGKIEISPIGANGNQPNFVLTDVTAVPVDEWHDDYVRPQSGCVLVDGQCEASEFPLVPDATVLEAETDTQISQMRPEIVGLPPKVQTAMLYLTNQTSYLRGSTQRTGDHVLIVHYFQPSGPGSSLEAAVQGVESTPAVLDTHFCPSASGCRAVVRQAEGSSRFFRLGKDYSLTIKGSNGNEVYLDYVIAVPSDKFDERYLQESPKDLASDFIQQCGQDYFDVSPDVQGFCRQGTFSLASGFNNEALQCECNIDGSTTFQCEEMGGQCVCKPNVIGRKCNRCKSGYWGFPTCKLCNCPFNSVCDPVSGACICPPKVMGDRCDTCMPRTYGFHPITGCQECNCNPYGTNGSLDCAEETGKCSCKPNVGGRICDKCITGYYSFPHCQACHYCDIRGATDAICDQQSGQCICKENVAGPRCDMCKPSTFLLDTKNPLGCTKCFCFGVTNQCQPSVYYRTILPQDFQTELAKWTTLPPFPVQVKGTGVEVTVGQLSNPNQEIFWVAPPSLLGNRITSYGGKLSYSVNVAADGTTGSLSPDVVLKGRNMTVVYLHDKQPVPGSNQEVEVEITEGNFEHESGNKVTRDQLMLVLVNLEALHIKAGYFTNPKTLTLMYATLEGAVPPNEINAVVPGTDVATKVEECNCPPPYSGSSCENCAALHYRSHTGPFLGICLPCDCNNHAERCDPETGQCINCIHNTTGERCDQCVEGYHGDALRGSPHDCMICACPLPIASNNFATSCQVTDNGFDLFCQCRSGYTGDRCQYCAPGFFGNPETPGGYCKPCECNGHTDPTDPESCDPISGECLKCLNNTSGPQCNTCRTDFFGDPTTGGCQACDCDQYGTEDCNSTDGTCKCWPNVEGLRCDRCSPGHWEFESGKGCTPCFCGLASRTQQCSNENGQCVCQPGVVGKRCDHCQHGFWNYTSAGCTRCACATKYSVGEMCDQQTGHCSCLPGVTGSDCDRCKPRHVLVENVGCEACGYCVHTLLDDFDDMNEKMDAADREFERVSASQFALIRLNRVNESIGNLTQAVIFLTQTGAPQTLLGFDSDLAKIELAVDKKIKQVGDAKSTAEDRLTAADRARDELVGILRSIGGAKKNVTDLAANIAALDNYLRQGPGSKVTESTTIAEPILATLRNRKFDDYRSNASFELATAKDTQGLVRTFQAMYNATQNRSDIVQKDVKNFQEKMRDLEKLAVNASETVAVARVKIESVKENITDNVDAIAVLSEMIRDLQGNSTQKADASKIFFTDAQTAFGTLDDQGRLLKTAKDQLKELNDAHRGDNRGAHATISESRSHVAGLDYEADRLDQLFKPTRSAASAGKRAASAYGDIVNAVNEANAANSNSTRLADEIASSSANIKGNVADTLKASQGLHGQAEQSKIDALQLRSALDGSRNKGQTVRDQHGQTEQVIASVRSGMKQIPRQDITAQAGTLQGRAVEANNKAAAALAKAEAIQAQMTGTPNALTQRPDAASSQVALQEILLAENAARTVPQELPQYNEKIERASVSIARVDAAVEDLGNKLDELKKKIELTRSTANRIKVGMQIYRNNSVQLKNPADVAQAAAYTHISMYFKTPEQDGLLLYLGNEVGTSRRVKRDFSPITDDYMALMIDKGYVVLLFDLGSGHSRIEVKDRYVSDNQWHQVILERIGKTATVKVRSERGPDGSQKEAVAEGRTEGPNTVFNLNQENSTFFVGGMPLSFRSQAPVTNKRFAGYIEELEFDMEPIGLWNFGNFSFDPTSPSVPQLAPARSQLLVLPTEDGIKLDGSGYAIYGMEGRVDVSRDTVVNFELRTFDKEGLLFLLSNENSEDFLSLEFRDGHVVFQYNLGSGTVSIRSPDRYDDGRWHTILAERTGKRGSLQIDDIYVANVTSPGHEDKLEVSRNMLVGGHKVVSHASELTGEGFEGCIRHIQIGRHQVKLDDSKEAKGTILGCPDTIRRMVSFGDDKSAGGYLAMPAVNVESSFQITLKFKTVSPNGLLFLTASEDNSQILSLSMQDGKLVLASDDGRGQATALRTELSGYWNGEWHYVSASKQANNLRLMIDDFETVQAKQDRGGDSLQTTKPLYFGGVPDTVTSTSIALPAQTRNFIGCIGDVVVNDVVQNFGISQEKPGASFASCLIAVIPGLPTLPPQPTPSSLSEVTILSGTVTPKPKPVTVATVETTQTTRKTTTTQTSTSASTFLVAVTEPATTPYTEPALTQCALPLTPDLTDTTHSNALQFGSRPQSRQEFSTAPASFMDKSEFSLEFKTNATDGIILYVDDQKPNPIDFIAIYFKAGQLVYSFNPGSGPAVVRSPLQYNDGQWHTLSAIKRNRVGQLLVDGTEVQSGESPGTTEILNTKFPLYFGGMNGNRNASKNTEGIFLPFNGCLRNLRLNNAPFASPSSTVAVGPCSEKTEPGAFFFAEGGYISLRDKFVVGQTTEISIEIRPRSNNGLILAVGTSKRRRDFLALQLVDGVVKFSFDNGGGVTEVSVPLSSPFSVCDGGWHTIKATKSRFVASLEVDGRSDLNMGRGGQSAADTDLPLYLGSLPDTMPDMKNVQRNQYVGCMRNLLINNQPENFATGKVTGNVLSNSCHIA